MLLAKFIINNILEVLFFLWGGGMPKPLHQLQMTIWHKNVKICTLMARSEMQAPWSRKAKYTPFFVTGMDLTSVLMITSLFVLNLPSPAAIRPTKQTFHKVNSTAVRKTQMWFSHFCHSYSCHCSLTIMEASNVNNLSSCCHILKPLLI